MRFITPVTDEKCLKDGIADDVVNKMVAAWKSEYGEMIDYGGGEKDIMCSDVMRVCEGKPIKLQRAFGLSKVEASAVLDYCTKPN